MEVDLGLSLQVVVVDWDLSLRAEVVGLVRSPHKWVGIHIP